MDMEAGAIGMASSAQAMGLTAPKRRYLRDGILAFPGELDRCMAWTRQQQQQQPRKPVR